MHVKPTEGAPSQHLFSSASRRFVQCASAQVIETGFLFFASPDASGEPYIADLDHENPPVWNRAAVAVTPDLAAEVRRVCGPVLREAEGDEAGARQLEELLKPPLAGAGLDDAAPPSAPQADAAPFGSAKARIRLFQQNGLSGGLSNEAACRADDSAAAAGAGFWDVFASTFHAASNTSIGMPETETTRTLSDRSKAGSKAYFVEREVTAQAPVTLNYSFESAATGRACRTVYAYFIPEPGADYEARMDLTGGYCILLVRRIDADGSLLRVPLQRAAPSCPPAPKS